MAEELTEAVPAESESPEPPAPTAEPHGTRPLMRLLQAAAVLLVAGLLALLVWKLVVGGRGSHLVAQIRDNQKPIAPAFLLPVIWPHSATWPPDLRAALADGKISPLELRSHPVVLNFWASWCIPCRAEARLLAASARAHAGRVAFLGIDVQDFTGDARRFLRKYGVDYVSVRDGSGSTYDGYGLTGVPETYYVNSLGHIVAHSIGQVSPSELEDGIQLASQPAK